MFCASKDVEKHEKYTPVQFLRGNDRRFLVLPNLHQLYTMRLYFEIPSVYCWHHASRKNVNFFLQVPVSIIPFDFILYPSLLIYLVNILIFVMKLQYSMSSRQN